jgi:MFS family permease
MTRMSKAQTLWVTIAALVTLLVSILDSTIVTTTAVPIARALHPANGTASVPWLLAAYALASTVVQPLYGKLADSIGVRDVYLVAVGLFVIGSVLCGLAVSMPELIVFRALQGLGGGGLMSLTMVVIGNLRADDESGTYRGNATAAVLVGLGLICGPLVGGVIVRQLDWRWVFFVNVPLGIAAFVIMAICLRLPKPVSRGGLELPSAGLLGLVAAALLIVCEWGGRRMPWLSWPILVTAGLGLAAAIWFARRQLTVRDPFFPVRLLREPTLRVVTALQLATGCGMAAGIVYLTLELQLVRGSSPILTGVQLIPMALGLGLGSALGSWLVKTGRPLKASLVWSAVLAAVALLAFAALPASAPIGLLYVVMVLFGTGVGLGLGNEMLLVFIVVERRDLGVATTGIRFVETLGTSLGATVFATVFAALVTQGAGRSDVAGAIDLIFLIGALVVAASAVIALRLPDITPQGVPTRGERGFQAAI